MDKLRAIEVFIAIARHGSLTEAAKLQGKSLPTVVRTLAALERELGVRLFNRTTRRIALTQEGEIYLAQCASLLEEMSLVEDQLRGDRKSPEGKVKIASPVMFGERAVAPVLCDILQKNPLLDFEVNFMDRYVDLLEEHIDISVRIAHLRDSSLIARKIGTIRLVLCASPAFLEQHREPKVPDDLETLPCIQHNGANAGTTVRLKKAGRVAHIRTSARFRSNTTNSNILACVNGVGVGWFYSYQVAEHVRSGALRLLLEPFETDPVPVNLIYPHSRLMSQRVQFVLDELQVGLRKSLKEEFALPD